MDGDSWRARLSSASKRYQSALQSRSDFLTGFDEIDGDGNIKEEYPCPYCLECFDVVGLCSHIDEEHPVQAKIGNCIKVLTRKPGQLSVLWENMYPEVCPVCATRVRSDMVAHITLQHGKMFKMQHQRKTRKGENLSSLSLLRKELREGNIQSLFRGTSLQVNSINAMPDPLLSSFILPIVDDLARIESQSSADTISSKKFSDESASERKMKLTPFSIKDHEENTRRCEFVQGMLLSTIIDDSL